MAISSNRGSLTNVPRGLANLVLLLCFLTILSEGYEVGIMGTIIPVLLHDRVWGLTPIQVTGLASASLIGTIAGAFLHSLIVDVAGRKRPLIVYVLMFSVAMIFAATATSPSAFAVCRLIAGVGLGGLVPVASSLTVEYSPRGQENWNFSKMYAGYSLGAVVSGAAGFFLMGQHNWQLVVWLGALPILLLPFLIMMLPESMDYLISRGRKQEASKLLAKHNMSWNDIDEAAKEHPQKVNFVTGLAEMFTGRMIFPTICHGLAQFTALLVLYGFGTWLPQLMRKSGYELGSSLQFQMTFYLTSAIGGVIIGKIADHYGVRRTIAAFFLLGACSITGMAFSHGIVMNYILVAITGFGTTGVALVLLGYIVGWYGPRQNGISSGYAALTGRAGALVGPVLGGLLAQAELPAVYNFLVFGGIAVITAIVVAITPKPTASVPELAPNTPAHA